MTSKQPHRVTVFLQQDLLSLGIPTKAIVESRLFSSEEAARKYVEDVWKTGEPLDGGNSRLSINVYPEVEE